MRSAALGLGQLGQGPGQRTVLCELWATHKAIVGEAVLLGPLPKTVLQQVGHAWLLGMQRCHSCSTVRAVVVSLAPGLPPRAWRVGEAVRTPNQSCARKTRWLRTGVQPRVGPGRAGPRESEKERV